MANTRKTDSELVALHEYGISIRNRTIFIGGPIDEYTLSEFIKNVHLLSATDDPITISISTYGGEVYGAFGFYDQISHLVSSGVVVTGVVHGYAMSAGALILQACSLRLCHPNSRIMFHPGYAGVEGHTMEVMAYAEETKFTTQKYYELLYRRMIATDPKLKKSITLRKLMDQSVFDKYVDPPEALKMGLIDGIIGQE